MRSFFNALAYYKELRLGTVTSEKYRHLLLLLFWPVFGAVFWFLERLLPLLWKALAGRELVYYSVECALDSRIPFCEWFVIPYYFWFVFLVGMLFYGLLFELQAFRNYMRFVILTYSATAVIYIFFPNMQALRPVLPSGGGLLVEVVRGLYSFDTNTNVCPSIHVLGAVAVCLSGLHSKRFDGVVWKLFLVASTVLICLSTVFLKQHSVIDVYAALFLSAAAYPVVYILPRRRKARAVPCESRSEKGAC